MDNWNGFPTQRDRILVAARDAGAVLTVLSGDSHNAWVYDLEGLPPKGSVESITLRRVKLIRQAHPNSAYLRKSAFAAHS